MRIARTTTRGVLGCLAALLAVALIAPAGPAAAGTETIRGQLKATDRTLDSGEYYDRHEITVEEGERLTILAHSSQFDTYLIIQPPGGVDSFDNDDMDTTSHDAYVEVDDAAGGTWLVFVTSARPGDLRMAPDDTRDEARGADPQGWPDDPPGQPDEGRTGFAGPRHPHSVLSD